MKSSFRGVALVAVMLFPAFSVLAQSNWKLTKNKDGIKVYQSTNNHSSYKSIKVECTLEGNIDKLIGILTKVEEHKNWVYNNKSASLLKKVNDHEFYFYSETYLPWPMSNRDAVMHFVIHKSADAQSLHIISKAVPDYVEKKRGKVRVKKSQVEWKVKMTGSNTMQVVYTFEADPGGDVPAWLVNSFADKGPYESFKKLRELLK